MEQCLSSTLSIIKIQQNIKLAQIPYTIYPKKKKKGRTRKPNGHKRILEEISAAKPNFPPPPPLSSPPGRDWSKKQGEKKNSQARQRLCVVTYFQHKNQKRPLVNLSKKPCPLQTKCKKNLKFFFFLQNTQSGIRASQAAGAIKPPGNKFLPQILLEKKKKKKKRK